MKKIFPYFLFLFLCIPYNLIAQSQPNIKTTQKFDQIKKDSSDPAVLYNVTAHFVDKGFKAVKSVHMQGKSLDAIQKQLNSMRDGFDIIIERVMVSKFNRWQELLKDVPSEFMRETDSLLKKRWAKQYSTNK